MLVSLEDIQNAGKFERSELVQMLTEFANSDLTPRQRQQQAGINCEPAPKPNPWHSFLDDCQQKAFQELSDLDQALSRKNSFKLLEAADTLDSPERIRLYPFLLELWRMPSPFARQTLLTLIPKAPLKYGLWKALKTIYKEAEKQNDSEIYGALLARLDLALAQREGNEEVKTGTLKYLVRRGWRKLKNMGSHFSAIYAQQAVDVLRHYPEYTPWQRTWIARQILSAERPVGSLNTNFKNPNHLIRYRAFRTAWHMKALLRLAETAQSSIITQFAIKALQAEHSIALRDITSSEVLRLIQAQKPLLDVFCVWLLQHIPRFEQAQFKQLGFHDAILRWLDADHDQTIEYAVAYIRSHAQDLPLEKVLECVNHQHREARKLGFFLLSEKDPREVGLAAWSKLIGSEHGHKVAITALKKHFSSKELDLNWFRSILLRPEAFEFAAAYIKELHGKKALNPEFLCPLLSEPDMHDDLAEFLMTELKTQTSELSQDFLRLSLCHIYTQIDCIEWVSEGYFGPQGIWR